jgi:hypothetical protein
MDNAIAEHKFSASCSGQRHVNQSWGHALLHNIRLNFARLIWLFPAISALGGCNGTGSGAISAPMPSCSVTQLEAEMDSVLSQTASEVDFSF